jgi:hypothetical protein
MNGRMPPEGVSYTVVKHPTQSKKTGPVAGFLPSNICNLICRVSLPVKVPRQPPPLFGKTPCVARLLATRERDLSIKVKTLTLLLIDWISF